MVLLDERLKVSLVPTAVSDSKQAARSRRKQWLAVLTTAVAVVIALVCLVAVQHYPLQLDGGFRPPTDPTVTEMPYPPQPPRVGSFLTDRAAER